MVQRSGYLNQLIKWKDESVIKVVTGIRRCGKSTLLELYRNYLKEQGVTDDQIISINFEDLEYENLLNYKELYDYVKERLNKTKKMYLFFDEIQQVPDFQKTIDSLQLNTNVDIYITGSNAYILSGELATLLSGRYVEIKLLPFSFFEYKELRKSEDNDALFAEYLANGGFPYVALLNNDGGKINAYMEGIYNTIIIKDIEERQKRKNGNSEKRKINDLSLLKNISRFLASSIGNMISVNKIADYLSSNGRKTSPNTVADYVDALTEPYIFYPVERFDVVGKQLLKNNQKYYIADLGLRRYVVSRKEYDLGFSLENIVYFELLRRGFIVNVGKVGNAEVDFVARKNDRILYFQVAASLTDETTFEREIAALKSIKDNYPKTILTLDRLTPGNYNGINVVNAIDWLLDPAEGALS